MSQFIIGSTLIQNNLEVTQTSLQSLVKKSGGQIDTIKLDAKKFKLGNVDNLMHNAEVMNKCESQMEGLLRKIQRQYEDSATNFQDHTWKAEQANGKVVEIDQFIRTMDWVEKKYARNLPLTDLISQIQKRVNLVDQDFRQKSQTYNEKKAVQAAIALKEGNLAVKELADVLSDEVIKKDDCIYSQYITTVFCVVPKSKEQDFLNRYETVGDIPYVLPRSHKIINVADKDGYLLYRVFVYQQNLQTEQVQEQDNQQEGRRNIKRSPVESFIYEMREKLGINVREFHYDSKMIKERQIRRGQAQQDFENARAALVKACDTDFEDLYCAYIHLKYLRLVVDFQLRFQFEPKEVNYYFAVVKPSNGKEKRVLDDLTLAFCKPSERSMYGTKEELEDAEDFFPFSYIPINVL